MDDKYYSLDQEKFEPGDLVTRSGSDVHIIRNIDFDHLTMDVICIRGSWWVKYGQAETNLIRRYTLVMKSYYRRKLLTPIGARLELALVNMVNKLRR